MYIHCLGLNHETASVNLREALAFNDYQIRAALARQKHGEGLESVSEMIILSTCNRVEIYAISKEENPEILADFLASTHNLSLSRLKPHLYHYLDGETVQHLFEVVSGLDSIVLGEPQILGQVVHALELARGLSTVGSVLSRLFQDALHTGKRVRTETRISHNPASVSSLAASLAEKKVSKLAQAQITVVGAGEMAELAVEALRKRGAAQILVVNRTKKHAEALGKRWGAELAIFEELEGAIARSDIIITSTGAPHSIISAPMVVSAMKKRLDHPLVMIDIAVPRDIDTEAGEIANVSLYDMDSLHAKLETAQSKRKAEVPLAEAIIAEERARFDTFLDSLDILPLIGSLKKQAEHIRQAELDKTLRKLPNLSDAERKRIDILTKSLVKKLIDAPAANLRASAGNGRASECATTVRNLFGLQE